MFFTLIVTWSCLVSTIQAIYDYPKPTIPFNLPIEEENIDVEQAVPHGNTPLSHESVISYSVPLQDFNYLKQYKEEAHKVDGIGIEYTPVSQQSTSDGSILLENIVQQNVDPVIVNPQYETSDIINVQNIVRPQVTKDIYFHVPPPEIEDRPVLVAQETPKKIYKIIFIKVPSQKPLNVAELQQTINQQAYLNNVETKTLIYVLSKKPDPIPQPLALPKPTPSEHEVFFVNYKAA